MMRLLREFVDLFLEGRWEHETNIISKILMRKIVDFVESEEEKWPPKKIDISIEINKILNTDLTATLVLSMTNDLETDASGEVNPEFMTFDVIVTINVIDGKRGLSK